LKPKVLPNNIYKSNFRLAVNTMRVHYKNQPVDDDDDNNTNNAIIIIIINCN